MSLKVWLPLDGSLENKGEGTLDKEITLPSAMAFDSNGKIGSCLYTNGSIGTDTVYCEELKDVEEFSISLWINLPTNVYESISAYRKFFNIGCISDGFVSGNGVRIEHTNAEGGFQCAINKNPSSGINTNNWYTFTWGHTEAKNKWCHIVIIQRKDTLECYLNGKLNTSLLKRNYANTVKLTGYFNIGEDKAKGYLNDFRIYDHALSTKEVKEISKALIVHYKLDNSSPTGIEKDVSGYGHDGVKNGDLTYSADSPRYVGCTGFWGQTNINAQQYIYADKFDFLKDDFSVSCWFKMNMTKTGMYQAIISQGRDANNIRGFNIFRNQNSDLLIDFGGLPPNTVTFTVTVRDEKWHHIVFTLNKSEGSKVFFDGKYITKNSYIEPDYTHAPKFLIGKMAYGYVGSTTYFPFNGNISDVRLYATALSEEDVKELYETSVSIGSDGNIYAYDFVNGDKVSVGANGVVTATDFVEGDKVQFYDDGTVKAKQFIRV